MIISPIQNTGRLLTDWIQVKPRITQRFPDRPEFYSQFGLKGHGGLDFGSNGDLNIFAPFSGEVKVIDSKDKGYGLHVYIRDGGKECVLGHLSEVFVKTGDKVFQGEEIGIMGTTGESTGVHLHFGLRFTSESGALWSRKVLDLDNGYNGYVDPAPYIICWKGSLIHPTL